MAGHFIIPKKYYQMTLLILIILTIITVLASKIEFGFLNTPIAILIATVKATFVGAFFMGLRWEKENLIFVFGAVATIILFFLFTFADLATRGAITKEVESAYHYDSPVKVVDKDPYEKGEKH